MFTSHDAVCIRYRCLGKSRAARGQGQTLQMFDNIRFRWLFIRYRSALTSESWIQCSEVSRSRMTRLLCPFAYIFRMEIVARRNLIELWIIGNATVYLSFRSDANIRVKSLHCEVACSDKPSHISRRQDSLRLIKRLRSLSLLSLTLETSG